MKVFEERALAGLAELKLNTAALDLDTLAQRAAAESWSYTEFLGHLLDGELKHRQQVRVEMSLQFARFPYPKRLDEFDFKAQPAVDKRLVEELATGRFLAEGRNIIFLGPPGVGKTHLAIALGVLTAPPLHRGKHPRDELSPERKAGGSKRNRPCSGIGGDRRQFLNN